VRLPRNVRVEGGDEIGLAARLILRPSSLVRQHFVLDSALVSPLRISAFLCASAVQSFSHLFTAEAQRNAEIRREVLEALPSWAPPTEMLVS
jgi:hypothetical protein